MASRSTQSTRARDIDRALVVTALDNAYADGQLTFDERRARQDRAESATTLGQLHALSADLQAEVALPEPRPIPTRSPQSSRRGPVLLGAAVVVVVIVVAAVLGVVTADDETSAPAPAAAKTVAPIVATPFDFVTAEGLVDFRARFLDRFGDPTVTDLTVFPSDHRASVDRVVEGRRIRSVSVAGGFDQSADTSPLGAGYLPFDISQIDLVALADAMAGAAAAVGVPEATVTHVIARNMGTPEILVFAADADNRGGYVQTDFAANVTRVAAYRP